MQGSLAARLRHPALALPAARRRLSAGIAPRSLTGRADDFLAALDAARPEIVLGLEPSRALLAALGDPHAGLRVLHVAGTNGKGSVCAMAAAALRAAGLRVGTYSSPHRLHASDAVTVDGAPDPAGWAAAVEAVCDAAGGAARAAGRLTAFEAATAAMWAQLAAARVDVAVVEVGVGTPPPPHPLVLIGHAASFTPY